MIIHKQPDYTGPPPVPPRPVVIKAENIGKEETTMSNKPTKAELLEAAAHCMVGEQNCVKCPRSSNGINDGSKCAADLLIQIAIRMKNDDSK